jgi:hypothetical protein
MIKILQTQPEITYLTDHRDETCAQKAYMESGIDSLMIGNITGKETEEIFNDLISEKGLEMMRDENKRYFFPLSTLNNLSPDHFLTQEYNELKSTLLKETR